MIKVERYRKKLVGVYGLGRTGLQSVKSLIAGGSFVIAWDDNIVAMDSFAKELDRDINLKNAFNEGVLTLRLPLESDFEAMHAIVMSPGIPIKFPYINEYAKQAESKNVVLISDIELLQISQPSASYIGITGTNGKSTTTSLIAHILKSNNFNIEVGGNIGESALKLKPLDLGDFYVIEASSFQLDLCCDMHFDIAIALSIRPDHIDRHGSFSNYFAAKKKIFAHQCQNDYAIVSVNADSNMRMQLEKMRRQKIIPISSNKILDVGISVIENKVIDNYFWNEEFYIPDVKSLLGEHNRENIAAAFAATAAAGLRAEQIIGAIKTFKALPHRMEVFFELGGLKFINDSKATNADAAYWALNTFDDIYWILGGIAKDGGIESLTKFFHKVSKAFLIGSAANEFAKILKDHNVPYSIANDLESAVKEIKLSGISKGNILLSPACASQDQWKNYEERGNKFRELIFKYYS